MNLSEKIDVLMKQNNIKNPKELSEKLNEKNLKIPYTTLLTIINNEVQDIKLGTARKLCTFFNLTLDQLLDDDIEINNTLQTFSNSIDTNGLDDDDINEINRFIEFLKNKKKNDK